MKKNVRKINRQTYPVQMVIRWFGKQEVISSILLTKYYKAICKANMSQN